MTLCRSFFAKEKYVLYTQSLDILFLSCRILIKIFPRQTETGCVCVGGGGGGGGEGLLKWWLNETNIQDATPGMSLSDYFPIRKKKSFAQFFKKL